MTDPFAALADPARRRLLELMRGGERSAGELVAAIHEELGLTQPTVSQHLGVLRSAGLVSVRAEGSRRLYRADPAGLHVVAAWLAAVTPAVDGADVAGALDALATEVARGKRQQRRGAGAAAPETSASVTAAS